MLLKVRYTKDEMEKRLMGEENMKTLRKYLGEETIRSMCLGAVRTEAWDEVIEEYEII